MQRRELLRAGAMGFGALMVGSRLAACGPYAGPYGKLRSPDANGIKLPVGFTSRVVARSGEALGPSATIWHGAPDGGATFAAEDGGWVYVSNAELALIGGASAVRFDAEGDIVDAQRILAATSANCAGGPTPWGTWLSCEEFERGQVWECDPLGSVLTSPATARPALGRFAHEAAAVDPVRGHVYLTEDRADGRLYRFTPTVVGDLSAGVLHAAIVADGLVSWLPVPDPTGLTASTRYQVPESTVFRGGEGAWFADDTLWFTTKFDNRVWALEIETSSLTVLYDVATARNPILTNVDNLVRSGAGDLFVCEDGSDLQLILLETSGKLSPFLQLTGQTGSELTGAAFDPSGTRLYFSSQRGPTGTGPGLTYEVSGPFRS